MASYRAIDQLVGAGFFEEITGRKKDRVWAASEVMAELDDLDRRIQTAMYEGSTTDARADLGEVTGRG